MKKSYKLFFILIITVFLSSCRTIPIIDWNRDAYLVSCPPIINSDSFEDTGDSFIFKLNIGDVGGCPTDKNGYEDDYIEFTHSERQEINWPLNVGTTVFTAKFRIEGAASFRNSFFQVHDGNNSGPPPTYIGVDENFNIRVSGKKSNGEPYYLTLRRYSIEEGHEHDFRAIVTYDGESLDIEYYIDDQLVFERHRSHVQVINSPYTGYPFIKIGQYRINAEGTTIFRYRNVLVQHTIINDM